MLFQNVQASVGPRKSRSGDQREVRASLATAALIASYAPVQPKHARFAITV